MQFGFREMIFTSLSLGMVAGTYAMVVQPHARAREKRVAEMHAMDVAIADIHKSTDGLDDVACRVDRQQQATNAFRSRMPGESDSQKTLDEVIQTAVANSLQAGEVTPLKRRELDGVIAQPVKLRFSGNFNGFYAFLLQLEGMPLITRTTQIDLSGIDDRDGQIQAEMTLTLYFAPQLKVATGN
jgi:type IV pilus assembly protein PilO